MRVETNRARGAEACSQRSLAPTLLRHVNVLRLWQKPDMMDDSYRDSTSKQQKAFQLQPDHLVGF